MSKSKVYSLLKRLYQGEMIHRFYDQEAQAQRNTISSVWGDIIIDDQFAEVVTTKLSSFIKKNFFPIFQEYLETALDKLGDEPKTKKWLPQDGKTSFCKKCHESHEAVEFFSSLIDIASSEFQDSKEFTNFLTRMKFSDIEED